ncbi:MAG: hypothetical protein IIC66_10245 [candidate division Zixibacteria bacterium]|nr:hypothetical protein [candidate division Zixibacteria bacterium]
MRLLLLSLFLSTMLTASTFSQEERQDIIYLENGSVVKGIIVELVTDVSVKIKLQDGIVYIYPMDEVRKIIRKEAPKERKSPELAFVLSLIFPGGGQFYNGDISKGITQQLLIAAGLVLVISEATKNRGGFIDTRNSTFKIVGITMVAGGVLWSLIDAPISASKKNKMLAQNQYGHLLEFQSGKHVVGFDLSYYGSYLGGKLTLHF